MLLSMTHAVPELRFLSPEPAAQLFPSQGAPQLWPAAGHLAESPAAAPPSAEQP